VKEGIRVLDFTEKWTKRAANVGFLGIWDTLRSSVTDVIP
jgi:hypothetical protein